MSEKLLFLAIVPVISLVIMLAWIWLISTGRRSTKLSLHGLGIKIEFCSEEQEGEGKVNVDAD